MKSITEISVKPVQRGGMSLPSKALALAVTLIVVIALAVVFSRNMATAPYTFFDEYLSLERSVSFIKFNDWLHVYSHNKPSTMKPPLQYWLNAVDVKLGVPEFLAFRLWSYLFMLGSIVATGLCAAYLCKDNLWALPAAMLLLAGSRELVVAGRSAMLDSGHSFFLVASVLSFFYARENSRWWIVCGAMVGLGALQKSPIALLFIVVMLYTFNKRRDAYYHWQNLKQTKQFNGGRYLAIFLLISWPLLQTVLDGSEYLKRGVKEEILERFSPIGEERFVRGDFFNWVDWLWNDIQVAGVLALLCMFMMLMLKRWRRDNYVVAIISVALLVMGGFSLAVGKTFPRYLVILTPFLVILLVKFVNDVLSWKPVVLLMAVIITVISVPRIQAAIDRSGDAKALQKFSTIKAWIDRLDNIRESRDVLFIDGSIIPRAAYGYFGKSTKPFVYVNVNQTLMRNRELLNGGEPVLGVTSSGNLELLESMVGAYQVIYRDADIVIWRRPALR